MNLKLITLTLLFIVPFSLMGQPFDNRKQTIVITNVTVIPMDGSNRILENQNVVVKKGKITHIGNSKIKFADKPLFVDGKGKFLIPGLAEMHAHVPTGNQPEWTSDVMKLYALNGVTTIRSMLGDPRHLELRSKIEKGEIWGPRIITSGPSFNGNSAAKATEASKLVREHKNAGYDLLKIHPGIPRESFDALARTAREVNIPMAGHVPYEVGIWKAIEAKFASVDHLDGMVESLVPNLNSIAEQDAGMFGIFIGHKADTSKIPALLKAMRDNKIWLVPTEALAIRWFGSEIPVETLASAPEMKYMPAKTREEWKQAKTNFMSQQRYRAEDVKKWNQLRRKLILASQQNGVGLLLGSDAPQVYNVPGFSVHQELQYLTDAGLTPYQALVSGTTNVGKYLGREDLGVLKVGAVSDFVLLNANPFTNIQNSAAIEGVMVGYHWLPKDFIKSELKKLEK